MNTGECVRLYAGEKEGRPGVVMRILEDGARVLVMTGTRTHRPELRHVRVEPNEPAGRALELYANTYFYASGVAVARVSSVRSVGKRCPPNVFLELERLIGAVVAAGR